MFFDAVASTYPFGFLFSKSNIASPSHYIKKSANLFLHPKTEHVSVETDKVSVDLIGTCVDVRNPSSTRSEIARNLADFLAESEYEFHRYGDQLCGRYVIIFSHGGIIKVVGDAACTKSVFFSSNAEVIGSHAKMVQDALDPLGEERLALRTPFKHGHPGRHTPYSNILLLTPNTTVEMGTAKTSRFFPREPIKVVSVSEAAEQARFNAFNALRGLESRPLLFSVTAGLDSRTTLAISPDTVRKSNCFTYAPPQKISPARAKIVDTDVRVAKIICERIGAPHFVVVPEAMTKEISKTRSINSYKASYSGNFVPLLRRFGQHNFLHIRSNLLEVGRTYYHNSGIQSLSNSSDAASLFKKLHKSIIYDSEFVKDAFLSFYSETHLDRNQFNYDARDLFYWEHRLSAWHAQNLLCTDIVFDTFNVWNCRSTFVSLLSVPFESRSRGDVAKEIIEGSSQLAGIPFNPQ